MWALALVFVLGLIAIFYGVSLLIKGEKESLKHGFIIFMVLEACNIMLEWGVRIELVGLVTLAMIGSYKFFQG